MNAAYGAWGGSFADRFRFPQVTSTADQGPTSWQWAQEPEQPRHQLVRVVNPAQDFAAITTGIGSMSSGIAALVHGGRPDVQVAAAVPPTPPVAPTNTGLVILGVGSVILLGLLGVASMQRSRR